MTSMPNALPAQADRVATPEVTALPGPHIPPDRALASLGLLMYAGGESFAWLALFFAAVAVLTGHGTQDAWSIVVACGLCALRSVFHRAAGAALCFSPVRRNALRLVHAYIGVALAQSVLCTLLLAPRLPGVTSLLTAWGMFMAWPVVLLLVLRLRHIRGIGQSEDVCHDKGAGELSSLMLACSACGIVFAALMLYRVLDLPGRTLMAVPGLCVFAVFALLLTRAIMHAVAGKAVLSTGADRHEQDEDPIRRYVAFSLVSSLIIGTLLSLLLLGQRADLISALAVLLVVMLLCIWPRALRRFMQQRGLGEPGLAESGQGAELPIHSGGRAIALGWVLLAASVHELAAALPAALASAEGDALRLISAGMMQSSDIAYEFGRSSWLAVAVALLQLWTAIELITVSPRLRVAATIYGILASGLTVYLIWPFFGDFLFVTQTFRIGPMAFRQLALIAQVSIAVALPLVTLVITAELGFHQSMRIMRFQSR